jgi:hypothetical protein
VYVVIVWTGNVVVVRTVTGEAVGIDKQEHALEMRETAQSGGMAAGFLAWAIARFGLKSLQEMIVVLITRLVMTAVCEDGNGNS